ncbi:MAG: histidine--tRNA ligase [bacterium]|nr:histidine--tRNA ligase [bacterium]
MNKVVPKIMPGFMELLPEDQILFNEMIDTIRRVYEKFGFLPLDTPILEYSNVLLAKAGGETEKQIYHFLKGSTDISMRFDLTVPLARYVSMRQNDLIFPFKRYQIGKVYRGERPQKGRYREFYQCDIDVIGENLNTLYDAEIPAIIYNLFKELNFGKFTIRINNRKVLNGFFESLNLENKISDILRIIDKLEKIGISKVKEELSLLEISSSLIEKIIDFINIKGSNNEILSSLSNFDCDNETFIKGVTELNNLISNIRKFGVSDDYFTLDLTIARGLDYYTGTVYETILDDHPSLGSICSGGRYDNLTKYYTDNDFQGIGISIGITRLFSKLKEMKIATSKRKTLLNALIIPFDNENINYAIKVSEALRSNNIICDIYYENKNFKQKMKYANKIGTPYIIILGSNEEKENLVTIKNMETGNQETISFDSLKDYFK